MSGTEPADPDDTTALEVRRDDIAHGAGSAPRVVAAGELDAAGAPPLVGAVTEAVTDAAADTGRVVVDLDGITFCDSRGLSALVGSMTSAARARVSLRLVAGRDSTLAQLVGRTGMTELLPLHPDTDAALAAALISPLEREVAPDGP